MSGLTTYEKYSKKIQNNKNPAESLPIEDV